MRWHHEDFLWMFKAAGSTLMFGYLHNRSNAGQNIACKGLNVYFVNLASTRIRPGNTSIFFQQFNQKTSVLKNSSCVSKTNF